MIDILVLCILLYGKDFSYETPSLELFDRAVGIANWLNLKACSTLDTRRHEPGEISFISRKGFESLTPTFGWCISRGRSP
jgi:hypothetical protein